MLLSRVSSLQSPNFSSTTFRTWPGRLSLLLGATPVLVKRPQRCAQALLVKNAKVYIATRSEDRAKAAIEDLKQTTGKEAIWLKLDLSSLKSVKAAAEEFLGKELELHILFNNAGVMGGSIDQVTVDGYDMTWGTNTLGPFYFTTLLLPALFKASTPENKSRVVNTSSAGSIGGVSLFGSGLDFATFKDSPHRRKYRTIDLYGQSKFGNVVFTQELARRHGDRIVTTAVHPGVIRSELGRNYANLESWFSQFLMRVLLYPTPQGALTQLWAGTSPETVNLNGEYLVPWARVSKPRSNDPELGRELWTWFEEQVANI